MNTPLDDSIQCLAHFKNGRLIPLRFLWKNRSYKINSITSRYQIKDGGVTHLVFAALSNSNLYELHYNPSNFTWRLNQISPQF